MKTFDKSEIGISDNGESEFRSLIEIINEIKKVRDGFSTSAMSEYVIYLQGYKECLDDVINYLERI